MTWIHCLNCGWQGEVASGKAEKLVGGLLLVAGAAVGGALHSWIWGGILIGAGTVGLLVGLGAGSQLNCPHCQSTDIKKYKPSIDAHTHSGGSRPPPT